MNSTPSQRRNSWLIFAALMGLLLLLAAQRPLALPDEGRYGEIGRWMLQSGDFLAPRLNGLPFFHKPPLLHWLQSGAYALWGVSAWSARLVPALHAGLLLLGLYLSLRRTQGEGQAQRAMLMLGSSMGFLIGGQYVNHDMLVAAWISTAIWCMGAAFMQGERPDTRLALAGFAACALGVLSKGLIGIVLPGMVILTWLLYTGQVRKILVLPWLRGLAVFGAVALPWFVLGQRSYPELFNYLIVGQHFSRYTGQSFNNQLPVWFYPVVLVALLFPWSLLAGTWLRPRQLKAAVVQDRLSPQARWPSLLWIWLLVIVVFFSLPKSKIVGYIFPVLPPAAALLAAAWDRWALRASLKTWGFVGLLCIGLGLTIAGNQIARHYSLRQSSRDVAQLLRCVVAEDEAPVYSAGGYPYDLPFYAGLKRPLIVLDNWTAARQQSGDNWRRELFEAGDFEPALAQALLQAPAALNSAPAGAWMVSPLGFELPAGAGHWQHVYSGKVWALWLATDPSAAKGPESPQQKRLARCQQKREQQ